ncbi:MAG: TadE/TadG family type IV pilus assembly protein [Candidatus Dormibacterales bacterium]
MSRGQALVEFAVAWPVALLLVLGCVQLGVFAAESQAAREAALGGARAGTAVGSAAGSAGPVAVAALQPWLPGTRVGLWCPGSPGRPQVWVCVREATTSVEVSVGGRVPALVPLVPGGGLPLSADARLDRERFR